MKMIGNVSDWLSYAGGALIKVADSAGSTVQLNKANTTDTAAPFWIYIFLSQMIFFSKMYD